MEIGVRLSGVSRAMTRSAAVQSADSTVTEAEPEPVAHMTLGAIGSDTLYAELLVEDYTALPLDTATAPATKGHITTTESLGNLFVMNAWLGSRNRYPNPAPYAEGGTEGRVVCEADADNYRFIEDAEVKKQGSEWLLQDATGTNPYRWRNDVPTTFWSIYPKTLANGTRTITWPGAKASDDEQAVLQFSYTLPSGTNAAERQEDLLFAYNLQTAKLGADESKPDYGMLCEGYSDMVDVTFRHALSVIRFDIAGALKESVTIEKLAFEGIAAAGTCLAKGDGADGITFEWTPSGTTDCDQEFYAGDFTEKSLDGTANNALQSKDSGKLLFLIPQQIKDNDVTMVVTYLRPDGLEETKRYVLDHETPWEAGKVYTYKIAVAANTVGVQVEDRVSDATVTDVDVKNTGNTRVYIRATVVGNWYGEDGSIVDGWMFSGHESEFADLPGENWVKESDGFYYYTLPVQAKEATTKLFTSFTKPTSHDARFELTVIAQAIRENGQASCREAFAN